MSKVFNLHIGFVGKGKIIGLLLPLFITLAALIYTGFGITSCKNVDKISDTLIFRYNEDATVGTLDPAFIKSQSEIWIAQQVFNSLVELDSSLKPLPSLAYRWIVSENATVYKFFLRPGVSFHSANENSSGRNGVRAKDVAYSLKRISDAKTASPSAWIFSGKIASDSLLKTRPDLQPFQAPNDSTFILTLTKPDPTMLALLGTVYCSIIPEGSAEQNPDFGRKPRGTGPFYVKLWEEDVKLVLRKNPFYFEHDKNGNRLPYLEAVNVDFIKNKQTAFMKFVSGEFDFFNGVESSFKDELLGKDGTLQPKYTGKFKLLRKPFLNTEYLGFWLGDSLEGKLNLYKNVHLRRALSYATDRDGIIRYLRNGLGYAGRYGFTPPVLIGSGTTGYFYNLQKAKEELAKAGYPGGKGLAALKLSTTADYLDMAVFIKKSWAGIGVKLEIEVQTGGMLRQLRNKGKLGIFRGSWIADVPDAENYLACFYSRNFSPGGPNYTHYHSVEFDRLYEASFLTNSEQRAAVMASADSLLMPDCPVLVLYYDQSIRLYQNQVTGLTNDPSNRLLLKRVKKQPTNYK
jgi:peptide/nickel transport system substrate-binding protein